MQFHVDYLLLAFLFLSHQYTSKNRRGYVGQFRELGSKSYAALEVLGVKEDDSLTDNIRSAFNGAMDSLLLCWVQTPTMMDNGNERLRSYSSHLKIFGVHCPFKTFNYSSKNAINYMHTFTHYTRFFYDCHQIHCIFLWNLNTSPIQVFFLNAGFNTTSPLQEPMSAVTSWGFEGGNSWSQP